MYPDVSEGVSWFAGIGQLWSGLNLSQSNLVRFVINTLSHTLSHPADWACLT